MSNLEKAEIAALIAEHGPLGVSKLATLLDVPISTLHRYLSTQKYFRQNGGRKWALPDSIQEEIEVNTLTKLTETVQSAIELALAQTEQTISRLSLSLDSIQILQTSINNFTPKERTALPPVAHPRLATIIEGEEKLKEAIRRNKHLIPTEYYDLIYNYDHINHIVEVGKVRADSFLDTELAAVILGDTKELSENVIEKLKEYQK